MPANEWTVAYAEYQIRVVKTRSDGARLYVDGELLDTANDLYASEDEATLIGVFGENDAFRIGVFIRPSTQAAIRVNDEWIAGDQVYAVASD
jgi:hypothetical protein